MRDAESTMRRVFRSPHFAKAGRKKWPHRVSSASACHALAEDTRCSKFVGFFVREIARCGKAFTRKCGGLIFNSYV